MNKYFIQLFLKENTVILPGFGALTAPNGNTEDIMFLPYLKTDDGKLAKFIVDTEGIALQDAQNTIAKFIREMEANLSKGESFDIFQFGSFFKNEDGEVEFSSSMKKEDEKKPVAKKKKVSGTPKVSKEEKEKKSEIDISLEFDTDSIKESSDIVEKPIEKIEKSTKEEKIVFAPIIDSSQPEETVKKEEPKQSMKEEKTVFAPIVETSNPRDPKQEEKKKKSKAVFWFVGLLALVAISVGIYILYGDQLKKNDSQKVAKTQKVKEPIKKKAEKTEESVKKETEKEPIETEKEQPVSKPVVTEASKGYYLISGVYRSTSQAETKVSKLTEDGITGKILKEGENKFYVSLADFTERKLATEKLQELREKGFKAWILEK